MKTSLLPYKIGLGVIGLITLIFLIVVLSAASNYKYDSELNNQANLIANRLNNYLNTHYYGVPNSLSGAGITNVPNGIAYTRLSFDSYKFCVNYKANSNGFSSTQVEQQLLSSSLGNQSTATPLQPDNSILFIGSNYHKGENCQLIKPYSFLNNQPYQNQTSTSGI